MREFRDEWQLSKTTFFLVYFFGGIFLGVFFVGVFFESVFFGGYWAAKAEKIHKNLVHRQELDVDHGTDASCAVCPGGKGGAEKEVSSRVTKMGRKFQKEREGFLCLNEVPEFLKPSFLSGKPSRGLLD